MRWREAGLFLLVSLFLSLFLYRDAFIGQSLLAPLDLGPDVFEQYRFMDPQSDGVPKNHYIVDQFTYDLPLQKLIYDAYHRGEIPWWDPYTFGGRPLLADAHINGTDPVRLLCYAILPFELAYNWNYILRGMLTGLGMFALLRWQKINFSLAVIFALGYSFAGWMTLYWGHPWIQGSFLYYPFLWVVWGSALEGRRFLHSAMAAFLVGLIFYAGNLQSHVYVVIFAGLFLVACFLKRRAVFLPALWVVSTSGLLGALLAAPVLLNQVEFFAEGTRTLAPGDIWWHHFAMGSAALGAFYPWMLGTFRTLDVTKFFQGGGIHWQLFIGPCVFLLAFWQLWTGRKTKSDSGFSWVFAVLLILVFLVIISTPARALLYTRCAALGGMGLVVLGAQGAQRILEGDLPSFRLMKIVGIIFLTVALGSSLLAWVVYPSFKDKVMKKVQEKDQNNSSFPSLPSLRNHQVNSLSNEVSLRNPEALLSLISVAALICYLVWSGKRGQLEYALALILVVSLLPVFLFHERFRPKQPILLWNRMMEGGPAQFQAAAAVGPYGRLQEHSENPFGKMIFPNALAALYRVHVVHGYSALQPKSIFRLPSGAEAFPKIWEADVIRKDGEGAAIILQEGDRKGAARLQSLKQEQNPVAWNFSGETLNTLEAQMGHTSGEEWIRTDTYFPGWKVSVNDAPLDSKLYGPCFTRFTVPASSREIKIAFKYVPTYLHLGMIFAAVGLVALGGLFLAHFKFHWKGVAS